MPKIEQAGYPFQLASHGIGFQDQTWGQSDQVVSGSGRLVYATTDVQKICVKDMVNPKFEMRARVLGDALHLGLRTKLLYPHATIQHPDFFANKFVAFALANFANLGVPILHIVCEWPEWSINNQRFRAILAQTGDQEQAARDTWSSHIAERYGFTRLDNQRIAIDDTKNIITVVFSRPAPRKLLVNFAL